jgi:hypothetical protein
MVEAAKYFNSNWKYISAAWKVFRGEGLVA